MKTLYIDCSMGIAGDMLLSALSELMPDQEAFIEKLNALGIPGVEYTLTKKSDGDITGSHIEVTIHGEVEESCDCHDHGHHHDHEHHHHDETCGCGHHEHHHHDENCGCGHHEHHHHDENCGCGHHHEHGHHEHNTLSDIEEIIEELNLSIKTQEHAIEVYEILARAESTAHKQPVDLIHFHEVGAMDAIADIVGVCQAISLLRPERIVITPINTGFGKVKCSHGIMDVPAPATANILEGMETYSNDVEGELCTPTGAALARYFADETATAVDGEVLKTGYGFGMKKFKYPNVVTAKMVSWGRG